MNRASYLHWIRETDVRGISRELLARRLRVVAGYADTPEEVRFFEALADRLELGRDAQGVEAALL